MTEPISDEHRFHTSGPNCHWCARGETAWVWGPYGTNICADCTEMIEAAEPELVVETIAAAVTVRDNWHHLDPQRFREHELENLTRWLEIRTTCEPRASKGDKDGDGDAGPSVPPPDDLPPDEPFDPRDI